MLVSVFSRVTISWSLASRHATQYRSVTLAADRPVLSKVHGTAMQTSPSFDHQGDHLLIGAYLIIPNPERCGFICHLVLFNALSKFLQIVWKNLALERKLTLFDF